MKIKTINKKRITDLENEVKDGVYVAPVKSSRSQDLMTKKLIEHMKKGNNR
ncbi:hypothetical protein M3221_23520 [Domibacillus indicus]|uniref:hypothetical protein n=1 Tax=Domibacillus indicus TaxID=1437523 RepID=UPI00203BD99B|nr:hypothetical protein [Domibacillus indicus]MCM3791307.1 hypothetical protein [Domibacillus indicus]